MKTSSHKMILWIVVPIVVIVLIVLYYGRFYSSRHLDSGIVKPVLVFSAHTAQLRGVRFGADDTVISGSVDSTIRIWKKSGEVIRTIKHPAAVSSIDISNEFIVTGSYDAVVRLWRISDSTLVREFKGHKGTVWSVAFSPDGKTFASSGEDAVINLWDVQTGERIRSLPGHTLTVWSVKYSPDGKMIASGSFDGTVKLWDAASGVMLKDITGHSEAVVDLAFSNNGRLLVSTSDDRTIKIWNIPSATLVRTLEVNEHVQAVVFSPDDKYLLTAGRDKPQIGEFLQEIFGDSEVNKGVSMRLWNTETGTLLQTFAEHSNDVNDVAWKGEWIASASDDHTVRLWRFVKEN